MTKLCDILENIGYKDHQLQEVTKLLYLTGGIDGNIKKEIANDLVSEMLNIETSIIC